MYSLETTNRYLKDLKLARKQNFNETELDNVIKFRTPDLVQQK